MGGPRVSQALAALLLGVIVLVGLLWANASESSTVSARTAAALVDTARTRDRAGFHRLFGDRVDAGRVETLWVNLGRIELLEVQPGPGESWRISWRMPGETGAATHLVSPQWRCGLTGCRLADIVQQPGLPTPVWLTGPIEVHQAERVSIIGGSGARVWLDAAEQAAEQLQQAPPAGLLRPAPSQVIEVPQNRQAFEEVMAASAVDFHGAGAITWVADSGRVDGQGDPAAVRIVINPDATVGIGDQSRFLLLLHEQAHAATSWLGAPVAGQHWVSEGYAEWVMLQHSADEQQRSAELLAAACPLPGDVPADRHFADPLTQFMAYAWSAAVIGQIIQDDPDAQDTIARLWRGADTKPQAHLLEALCP